MDILEHIKRKVFSLPKDYNKSGLDAVIEHIRISEFHYNHAIETEQSFIFNDVIYRTNQAFEGALKEAYIVMTKANSDDTTPYQIEKYLMENSTFRPRVMDLFTNYRKNWRNKTTHDHKTQISDEEAFLGICNVTAFVNILLDQIIAHLTFEEEKILTENISNDASSLQPFGQQIQDAIIEFNNHFKPISDIQEVREVQITAALSAFLQNKFNDSTVTAEQPRMREGEFIINPDIVIDNKGQKTLIEVKRNPSKANIQNGITQLMSYLSVYSQSTEAILYSPFESSNSSFQEIKINTNEGEKTIHVITQEDK